MDQLGISPSACLASVRSRTIPSRASISPSSSDVTAQNGAPGESSGQLRMNGGNGRYRPSIIRGKDSSPWTWGYAAPSITGRTVML